MTELKDWNYEYMFAGPEGPAVLATWTALEKNGSVLKNAKPRMIADYVLERYGFNNARAACSILEAITRKAIDDKLYRALLKCWLRDEVISKDNLVYSNTAVLRGFYNRSENARSEIRNILSDESYIDLLEKWVCDKNLVPVSMEDYYHLPFSPNMLNLRVLYSTVLLNSNIEWFHKFDKGGNGDPEKFFILRDLDDALPKVNKQVQRLDKMEYIRQLAVKYGARFFDIENDDDLTFSRAWISERVNMLTPKDLKQFHKYLQDSTAPVLD